MEGLAKIFKGGFVELGKFLGGKSTRSTRKSDRKDDERRDAERKQRKDAERKNRKTRRNNLF